MEEGTSLSVRMKELFKISALPVVFASLCCLAPVVLVTLGLATASFAASLADTFYGEYKWVFRSVGLALLGVSFVVYVRRKKGVCTLDEVRRRRNEIMNLAALTLIVGIVGYIFFLYVIVHYLGVWLAIWE